MILFMLRISCPRSRQEPDGSIVYQHVKSWLMTTADGASVYTGNCTQAFRPRINPYDNLPVSLSLLPSFCRLGNLDLYLNRPQKQEYFSKSSASLAEEKALPLSLLRLDSVTLSLAGETGYWVN